MRGSLFVISIIGASAQSVREEYAKLLLVPRVSKYNCHNVDDIVAKRTEAELPNMEKEGTSMAAKLEALRSMPLLSAENCKPYLCAKSHHYPMKTADQAKVAALAACPVPTSDNTVSAAFTANPSKAMSAVNVFGTVPGVVEYDMHVFQTSCGRKNFVGTGALAAGAYQSTPSDVFGTVVMNTRTTSGAVNAETDQMPGGINTFDNGLTYQYINAFNQPTVPGPNNFESYTACNFNGALAYCSDINYGADYDYNGSPDALQFCVGFKEGKYCDGTPIAHMYAWTTQNGYEYFSVYGAVNPFTTDPTKFLCLTSAKMPASGTGPSQGSVASAGTTHPVCAVDLCTA